MFNTFFKTAKNLLKKGSPKAMEKLTKSWVCDTLGLPAPKQEDVYTRICFAYEAQPGSIAILSVITSDLSTKTSQKTCIELADRAMRQGAKLLLSTFQVKDYPCLIVDDVLVAYCKIVLRIRNQFHPHTIAITGSIGKTTTTQMVYSVISHKYNTHRNGGSANNLRLISGVIQKLKPEHEMYVQEVMEGPPYRGASLVSKLVQPDIAIITLVGTSHMETFLTQERIWESCLSVEDGMKDDGLLILNGDDPFQWGAETRCRKLYYAINNEAADYHAVNIHGSGQRLYFDILHDGVTTPVYIRCFGMHNVLNALAAFAAGKCSGMTDQEAAEGLATFQTSGIRQNYVRYGGKNIYLDCYNAAVESIASSFDTLMTIPISKGGRRIAVIADIKEAGDKEKDFHISVGKNIVHSKIDGLICYGESARLIADVVRSESSIPVFHTESADDLVEYLKNNITNNDVVLYKGSHSMALEHIVDRAYGTWFHEEYERYDFKTRVVKDGNLKYMLYTDHATVEEKLSNAVSVSIPEYVDGLPVTGIDKNVFNNSKYTEEIVLPPQLKNIRYCAFYKANHIQTVTIPSSVQIIDNSAFSTCANLQSVTILEGCKHLGYRAFGNCRKLEKIILPGSIQQIGEEAFLNCDRLVVYAPRGSFAWQYAKDHGMRVRESDTPDENCDGVQSNPIMEESQSEEFENNPFKKSNIDFQYTISRRKGDPKQRIFFEKNGVWQQKNPKADSRAVILCGGDLMCEPLMSEACYFDGDYDYRPCFKYLKPALAEADLAIANLETLVSDRLPYAHEKHKVPHHTGPRYHCNTSVEYLDALKYAGFNGFVLANNHNADGSYEGIIDTLQNLDERGFFHTGLFRDADDARILHLTLNGIHVALLSYTEHINRGLDKEVLTETGCDIMLNRYSEARASRDIDQAKKDGAEFVLVYIHFLGIEYSHKITLGQREIAQCLADAGADCIMGSHMHAIQEFDYVAAADGRRVPVMYSLGNLISSDATGDLIARRSVIYRLVLKKENGCVTIADESYIPVRVVEATGASAFVAFPTLPCLRKNARSNFFEEEQRRIENEIGNKIKPTADCALSTSVPAAKKSTPSAE